MYEGVWGVAGGCHQGSQGGGQGKGKLKQSCPPLETSLGAGTLCDCLTCEETAALTNGDLPHQQVCGTGLWELAPLQSLLQHLLLGVQGPLWGGRDTLTAVSPSLCQTLSPLPLAASHPPVPNTSSSPAQPC